MTDEERKYFVTLNAFGRWKYVANNKPFEFFVMATGLVFAVYILVEAIVNFIFLILGTR